jgi:hypothetical protein
MMGKGKKVETFQKTVQYNFEVCIKITEEGAQ